MPPYFDGTAEHPSNFALISKEEHKAIASRGGKAITEKKKLAWKKLGSKIAKCKNCKLECDYKDACIRKDPEHLCAVPSLRGQAKMDGTRVCGIDDDRIKMYLDDLLGIYMQIQRKDNYETTDKKRELLDMRRAGTVFNKLIAYKKELFPEVQKNLNVNVDFSSMLTEWRKERKLNAPHRPTKLIPIPPKDEKENSTTPTI